jgi:hypothetical protein
MTASIVFPRYSGFLEEDVPFKAIYDKSSASA